MLLQLWYAQHRVGVEVASRVCHSSYQEICSAHLALAHGTLPVIPQDCCYMSHKRETSLWCIVRTTKTTAICCSKWKAVIIDDDIRTIISIVHYMQRVTIILGRKF